MVIISTGYILSSVLKDPQGFQQFLVNQAAIKPDIATQLMTATLNQAQVSES